jgi:hypothetical protein
MTNFTEQFKAQLEKFTPVTLRFLKKESPDYIKGFESFKTIVSTDLLVKIVEKENEMKQRELLKIRESLISSDEWIGCQSIKGTNFSMKTVGVNLKRMKEIMPFESLILTKESTENTFSFLNNPSFDDSEVVSLFKTAFTPPYTTLEVSHWKVNVTEIAAFLNKNTEGVRGIINALKSALNQGELCLDDRIVRELFAKHNLTFENIYKILNDVVENDISLNEKNSKMITSILENFCSAISDRITEICAQIESVNAEKKKELEIIKEKENEMKQKEFEKILKVESSLQCNYLINK